MKIPDEPLSPAQQEVMEIVWEKGELAAIEVRGLLADGRELARETVRTMLQRMEDKGWLKHRVVGRTFFYSAAVPRDDASSRGRRRRGPPGASQPRACAREGHLRGAVRG